MIQDLISYVHQLQNENKQLQKHIFNIQQQLNQKNQVILLANKKKDQLSEYIKKCENEIMKRQQRELLLLSNIETLTKQVAIYADEIIRIKQSTNNLKQKDESESSNKLSAVKSMKLPPKSHQKCKSCEQLTIDKDSLYIELQKQKEKTYMLIRDIECMMETFFVEA